MWSHFIPYVTWFYSICDVTLHIWTSIIDAPVLLLQWVLQCVLHIFHMWYEFIPYVMWLYILYVATRPHKCTHTLSLSHTHTHATRACSLARALSCSRSHLLALSRALPLARWLSRALSRSLALSRACSLSPLLLYSQQGSMANFEVGQRNESPLCGRRACLSYMAPWLINIHIWLMAYVCIHICHHDAWTVCIHICHYDAWTVCIHIWLMAYVCIHIYVCVSQTIRAPCATPVDRICTTTPGYLHYGTRIFAHSSYDKGNIHAFSDDSYDMCAFIDI